MKQIRMINLAMNFYLFYPYYTEVESNVYEWTIRANRKTPEVGDYFNHKRIVECDKGKVTLLNGKNYVRVRVKCER